MARKPNSPLQRLHPVKCLFSCFVNLININGIVIIEPNVLVDNEVVLVQSERHEFVRNEHALAAHGCIILRKSNIVVLDEKLVQVGVKKV
jgi:hypothetical protein